MKRHVNVLAAIVMLSTAPAAFAESHGEQMSMMSPGLMIPLMNPAKGRLLFASKGCVVCHSINGVGGEDAPMLDAEFMDMPMNPFEFAARMWRGAPAMIAAQEDELGAQIEFTGEELGNIIAFVHDAGEQAKFSEDDIPPEIQEMMEHME
ncbi:cytochrome c [Mameliella sp. CS4]|uniref:c-type cytochrome n=1 Tax=Mameliella sp. CS4 TaxID=2862329 RepID=UPI001C5EF7C5|nr:c-type cytochrome [Mameliella sp. CS4]MBW4985275.1 cytochrome c [Mameliella sp. CS4]